MLDICAQRKVTVKVCDGSATWLYLKNLWPSISESSFWEATASNAEGMSSTWRSLFTAKTLAKNVSIFILTIVIKVLYSISHSWRSYQKASVVNFRGFWTFSWTNKYFRKVPFQNTPLQIKINLHALDLFMSTPGTNFWRKCKLKLRTGLPHSWPVYSVLQPSSSKVSTFCLKLSSLYIRLPLKLTFALVPVYLTH